MIHPLRGRRKYAWIAGLVLAAAGGGYYARLRSQAPSYEARNFLVEGEAIEPAGDEIGSRLRDDVDAARLRQDVEALAAPELEGRKAGSPGNAAARKRIAERLEGLGLVPVFADAKGAPSWFQEIVHDGETIGVNVAGELPGTDRSRDAVVLVAHYDHIGLEDGRVHPGADDNASGVAMALEIARLLSAHELEPRNRVVFLFPDAEEPPFIRSDRMGSVHFVARGPIPGERLRLGIVLDVMAGRPIRKDPDLFFVMGAENSPDLVRLVRSVPQPDRDARYELMSVAMIEAEPYLPWVRKSKSDYHAFRLARRPFLFLTSGTTPRYHTPEDTPDTLAYDKLAAETGFVADLLHRAAEDGAPIAWYPDSVDQVHDVRMALHILDAILAEPGETLEETLAALRQDRVRLLDFQARLAAGETLDGSEYRTLMLIGLRLQCALTRPTYTMCTKF